MSWCRWRRCTSRTTSPPSTRSPTGFPACRRSPASTPASIAASRRSPRWSRCRATSASAGVQRYGFHGLSYEYIASVLPQVAPEIAEGRVIVAHLGSGASLCALKNRKSVDSTLGFTALDGLCMGTRPGCRRSRRDPLSLPDARALREGRRDDPLQEVGPARHFRHQQRHARPARQRGAGRAPRRGLLRLPGREGDRRARRRPWRHRRPRVHRRHRRELARDPPPDLRGLRVARHRPRSGRQRRARVRGSREPTAACPHG